MTDDARRQAFEICRDLRCFVTKHLVGTDTWAEGYWCQCDSCVTVKRVADAVAQAVKERDEEIRRLREAVDQEHAMRVGEAAGFGEEITRLREALQRIQHHCAVAATHSAIEAVARRGLMTTDARRRELPA